MDIKVPEEDKNDTADTTFCALQLIFGCIPTNRSSHVPCLQVDRVYIHLIRGENRDMRGNIDASMCYTLLDGYLADRQRGNVFSLTTIFLENNFALTEKTTTIVQLQHLFSRQLLVG